MRVLNTLILAAAFFAATATAGAQQAAPAVRISPQERAVEAAPTPAPTPETTDFVLNAAAAWSDTAVAVSVGDQLQVQAQGRWAATSQQLRASANVPIPYTGPDGYPQTAGFEGLPLPTANRGALIGRIGENGAPFLIGSAYQGEASAEGRLYVSMNEPGQQFGDNIGRLAIRIARTPAPPPAPEQETAPEVAPQPEQTAPPTVEPPTVERPQTPPSSQEQTPGAAVPPGVIVAAVVGGLVALWLLGSALFGARPGASGREQREPNSGAVTARVVTNGEAQETLTITMRRAS